MADEITPTLIADLIAGEVVANEFLYLLADRDNSLLNHPALMKATGRDSTSDVVRVPHVGLGGYDLLSSHTPGSEQSNQAFTDGKTDVTIAPRAKRYFVHDFSEYLAAGKLGAAMFAQDLVISVGQTLISLIANVGDDFTSTVGTSGTDIDWDDIADAKATLGIAKANGQAMCILHPRQWGDLEKAALALGVLPAESMGGAIMAGFDSYKGRYMGVDFFTSSHVPTANAGADRAGCMFVRGGIAWADAQMNAEADPNIVDFGTARLERVRQGTYLSTSWMLSHYAGVAKAIDGAGVAIITDA